MVERLAAEIYEAVLECLLDDGPDDAIRGMPT